MNKLFPFGSVCSHSSCDLKCMPKISNRERTKREKKTTQNKENEKEVESKWKKLISHLFPSITNRIVYWHSCLLLAPKLNAYQMCVYLLAIANVGAHIEPFYIFIGSGPGRKLSFHRFHQIINSWLFSLWTFRPRRKKFCSWACRLPFIWFWIRILY